MSRLLLLVLTLGVSGCGASSNFNQIWGKDDKGADTLYVEARAAYDRGDFDEAESLVTKLLDRNPDNEAAAVLFGYISLSQGGIDPYALARALINLETQKEDDAAGANLQDPPAGDGGGSEQKSSDAASTLQALGSLINLSEADFQALSEKTFDNNGTTNIFDAENPILVPKKLTDDLRASVDVLAKMNKALKAVCRFVDPSVKTTDSRHVADDCAPSDAPRQNSAKAHFLWAFSHLTEAIVYQSVLLYQTAGAAETNFQSGATVVNNAVVTDPAGLSQFVADIGEMTNAVDAVFDTSEGSMMQGMLQNLTAVNLAFAQIAGLPDKMKERIANVILKVEKVGESFGGGADNNLKALKGQLTEKFSKDMGKKIEGAIGSYLQPYPGVTTYDQIQSSSDIPAGEKAKIQENITSMCTSYDNLTGNLDPEKKNSSKPTTCP